MLNSLLLLCAPLVLCACSPASPAQPLPFQFKAASEASVDLRVELDGLPLAFCFVQIQAAAQVGDPVETVFNGATDPEGRLRAEAALPVEATEVTVIVQHPGAIGPNTDELAAAAQGPFAPSSRQVIEVEDLRGLVIPLTEVSL